MAKTYKFNLSAISTPSAQETAQKAKLAELANSVKKPTVKPTTTPSAVSKPTIKPTVKAIPNSVVAAKERQLEPRMMSASESATQRMSQTSAQAGRPIGTPTAAPIAKTSAGAGFQYGLSSAFGGTKLGDGTISQNLLAKQAENEKVFGAAKVAGQFTGTAAQYLLANQAAKAIPAVAKLSASKQILPTMAVDQLVDNVVRTPQTILQGRQDGKSGKEIAKDVGKQNLEDLAWNAGMAVGGRALGAIVDMIKASKKPVVEAMQDPVIRKTIQEELGLDAEINAKEYMELQERLARELEAEGMADGVESYYKSFEPEPVVRNPIEGKYTKSKTEYNKAFNEFEEDIQTVQNEFKTNQLRADEQAAIKPELGIDFDAKIKQLDELDKPLRSTLAEEAMLNNPSKETLKLAGAAGVELPKIKQPENLIPSVKKSEVKTKVEPMPKVEPKIEPKSTGFDLQLFSKQEFEAKAKQLKSTVKETGEVRTYYQFEGKTYKGSTIDEAYADYTKSARASQKPKPRVEAPKQSVKPKAKKIIEQEIENGEKVRRFSKNVETSDMTNDSVRESLSSKPLTYEPITNKETLEKAYKLIEQDFDGALKTFELSKGTFKPETVPFARLLSNKAAEMGNKDLARKIIADVSEDLTKAGQFSQAAIILRQSNDPIIVEDVIRREIKRVNEEGTKHMGKKWNGLDLNDDEMKLINQLTEKSTDAEKDAILEQVYNSLNARIPITAFEKIDSWRRIAMLLNPKTIIRNVGGNSFMWGLDKYKNAVAQSIEKLAVKSGKIGAEQTTKSIGWSKDKNLVEVVDNSWNEVKNNLLTHGKYEVETGVKLLGRDKQIFKGKFFKTLSDSTNWLLNNKYFGDEFYLGRAYRDGLGQFMSARGIKEVNDEAMEYASQYALEATFRQANSFAEFINKVKKNNKVGGKLLDAAIPFVKTPANIAVTAYNYSPAKLVELMFKRGNDPAKVIDDLSKGMTGTSIVALGYGLASMGWAKGKYTSKSPEELSKAAGEQPYSIITPIGSYTYDWAQPVAVPLAMGVAAYEAVQDESLSNIDKVSQAIFAGGDALVNQTMVMNIKDIFEGYGSTSEKVIYGLPKNYVSQMIPTIFGQVARTADDKDRSNYSDSGAKKELNQNLIAKIPGARTSLQPKVDIWGKETGNTNIVQRAAQNMISPGTAKKATDDKTTKELNNLYKSTKESIVVPTILSGKITSKGVDYVMTAEELTKYQKELGKKNYKSYTTLFNSSDYKKASDEEKVKMVQKIRDNNYQEVKAEYLKTKGIR